MPFSAVPIPGVHPRVVSLRNCLPADACCDAVWLLGAVLPGGSLRSGNLAGLRLLAPSDGAYLFAPVSKWRRFATQTVCSNQPQQTSDDGEGGCGRPMRERGPMTPARRVWRTLLLVSVVKMEKIAAMKEQIKKMDHELECYHKKLPKANVEFKNANEASDQAFAKSCVIESRQRFRAVRAFTISQFGAPLLLTLSTSSPLPQQLTPCCPGGPQGRPRPPALRIR